MTDVARDSYVPAKNALLQGATKALPIVLGYIPVGFAYGVLAQKAGLSTTNTLLMSTIVYAGSSQLIAVGLFSAKMPALSIVATTFIVNLRHFLFSAAITPFVRRWKKRELLAFSFELTDETFAVHAAQFASDNPPHKLACFATNVCSQVTWILSTVLGIVAGGLIGDVRPFGLDYALPAMFIGLLILQLRTKVQVTVAVISGLLAVFLNRVGLDRAYVIVSTLVSATLGVLLEGWIRRKSSL